MPIIDLPCRVCTLPFSESHRGNPVRISRSIDPNDQISYDHGNSLLHKFDEFVPLAWVFCPLLSKYSKTSGAKYSGVLALICEGFSNEKADPKSISLTSFISLPSNEINMLSGFISAWTILNWERTSNIYAIFVIKFLKI